MSTSHPTCAKFTVTRTRTHCPSKPILLHVSLVYSIQVYILVALTSFCLSLATRNLCVWWPSRNVSMVIGRCGRLNLKPMQEAAFNDNANYSREPQQSAFWGWCGGGFCWVTHISIWHLTMRPPSWTFTNILAIVLCFSLIEDNWFQIVGQIYIKRTSTLGHVT